MLGIGRFQKGKALGGRVGVGGCIFYSVQLLDNYIIHFDLFGVGVAASAVERMCCIDR